MNVHRSETSEKPAVVALIASLLIFVPVLTRGWQNLFSSKGLYLSIFLGLIIALIAVAFAWAIANERLRRPHDKWTALAYFFFLFNLSALGTINAAFVTFQAGNVIREEIENASDAVGALEDAGKAHLRTDSYDEFQRSAMDAWNNFRAELENPALCGQGTFASQRASEIRKILPEFKLLAWSGNCEDVPRMVAVYKTQIESLIANSPQYATEKEIIDFRKKLHNSSETMRSDLRALAERSSIRPDIQSSKVEFFRIAGKHSDLRHDLLSKIQAGNIDLPKIDTSTISAFGDIGQIIPFLMSRGLHISTYVYLLFAIVFDLVVIAAFMGAMRGVSQPSHANKSRTSTSKLY